LVEAEERMSSTIDLHFQGHQRVIATAVIPVGGGVVLVDPGPTSCLPALERGLAALNHSLGDVRGLLLTHIHLDHAGAAGTIARRVPGVPVYVHEIGARHLASPEKLIASATRLYGEDMDRLWGEFLAVPAASLRPLGGGESLTLDGRRFDVAYTPGHAVHHVSYLDVTDGTAYVGDTAGIRVSPGYVLPATPPPDIDLERWEVSLKTIEAWQPRALYLTHFGPGEPPATHLAMHREALARCAEVVRTSLAGDGDDDARIAAWEAWLRADVRTRMSEEAAAAAESAAPFRQLWQGLARYWRKRAAATPA
jgi:glyoxylase-like metal-dependent hydrolase (beta-lactamase superfamily II)